MRLTSFVLTFLAVATAQLFAAEPARVDPTIRDLALEPPTVITQPGPQYTSQTLDYAMVIGMDRTPKGRIWAAWVAGGDSEKGFFVAATSDDGGTTWSEPRLVIDPPDAPTGLHRRTLVGNFWTDPTGKLHLFFDQAMGYFDGRAGAWEITCDNPDADEPVWSAPRRIWHGCTLNKPLVLKNGDWLMPIALWTRDRIRPAELRPEFTELDAERMANLFVSTDQGQTWTRRGGVAIPQTDFDEHMFVELKDGRLWMLARTKYGIAETFSSDGGRTWTDPQPSKIQNVSARFFLRRLASGNLLLVKNGPLDERLKSRSQMTAFLSDDDGKTWRGGLVIDERDGVSYPDGFQSPDGVIHIIHDRNRAKDREILLAKFTEADVRAGKFVTAGSRGKIFVHKALGGAKPQANREPFGAYPSAAAETVADKEYDLVVVGGTAGGVACAVRAAREGLTVLLVNHTKHLGGFMTSGAGGWEAPYDGLRSPIFGELRTGAAEYYKTKYGDGSPQHVASLPSKTFRAHIDRPKIEPRVCEMMLNRMVAAEPKITVLTNFYPYAAERIGAQIGRIRVREMHGDKTVTVGGKIFCDAMYEADLAAICGVQCRIGRESRQEYGEPHAGVIFMNERKKEKGQRGFPLVADEGKLNIRPNSHATKDILPSSTGEADGSVMAYNYRLILTKDPANRVMVEKPANYDVKIAHSAEGTGFVPNLPNGKIAWNGGRLIGPQNEYSAGDWETRERISRQYLQAMLMRLWYMQNDPTAPKAERAKFQDYGLARDEFPDNGHVPYEIYVREARRLVGRYVFKEQDNLPAEGIERTPIHFDSIAMTDWPVDSVACTDRSVKGSKDEGVFFLAEEARPAQVPYRSLLPQGVDNLLVSTALSASHVGWGSIRLEPVWVQTGEAAGFAAALSLKHNTTPSKLDPDLLIRALCAAGSQVSFFNDVDSMSGDKSAQAMTYFGTKGFFPSYDARPDGKLSPQVAQVWCTALVALKAGRIDPQAVARHVAAAEQTASDDGATIADLLRELGDLAADVEKSGAFSGVGREGVPKRATVCRLFFAYLNRDLR